MKQVSEEPTKTDESESTINVAQRPFEPNIEGVVVRLHLGSGPVLFCDVLIATQRDLVVTIPKSEAIPDRGESVKCSLFLVEDDSYVAHREGVVHWEMALHGQRLAGIFLSTGLPKELLDLTHDDRRREVRYPANLACRIADQTEPMEGRLVNYSLNGLATQLPEPMTIGDTYTVGLDAGDDEIRLEATCRWSIKTSYGYVNGCSFSSGEGEQLARRVFRGSVMPWDINRTRSRPAADINEDAEESPSTVSSDAPARKELLSSTTILLLSLTLIGLSIKTPENLTDIAFYSGCLGLVGYIGLFWTSRMREDARNMQKAMNRRAAAETRLLAHVSTGTSLIRPNREKSVDEDS